MTLLVGTSIYKMRSHLDHERKKPRVALPPPTFAVGAERSACCKPRQHQNNVICQQSETTSICSSLRIQLVPVLINTPVVLTKRNSCPPQWKDTITQCLVVSQGSTIPFFFGILQCSISSFGFLVTLVMYDVEVANSSEDTVPTATARACCTQVHPFTERVDS